MYELLFRNFEAGDLRFPMHPLMMPNGKTDTNNNCAFSTDNIGMNYDYPEASYDERAKIVAEHARYQQGLMWTLANHPRMPEQIRKQMAKWGLAADEFTEAVRQQENFYASQGISAVPSVIFNDRHLVQGGQPVELFEQALRQLAGIPAPQKA
jgi:hypothetical protein